MESPLTTPIVKLTLATMVCLAVAGLGGACHDTRPASTQTVPESGAGRAATSAFLKDNAERYREAVARARRWLDGVQVDPIALRAAGIKGKKKLVELLGAYATLHAAATATDKPALLARFKQVAAITTEARYHDMAGLDDRSFKQDATSYLRAAYLIDRMGLDTKLYRREIAKIKARLDGHMNKRGAHQQMVFHQYYEHFGLKEPFDLAAGFKAGVIASRLDAYAYRTSGKVYDLTHEIFVPYYFGAKLDVSYFSSEDRSYLRRTLAILTSYYIMRRNADLLAELVSCLRYLKLTNLAVYRDGLTHLLAMQQKNGTWGRYEFYRKRYGALVDQGFYLHTTLVAVKALTVAFETPVVGPSH